MAAAIGDDAALALYQSFVLDAVDRVHTGGFAFRICFYPADSGDALRAWLGEGEPLMPQVGSDLGERMANAFAGIFSEGFDRAVLIGSDLPDLPPAMLGEAFASLLKNDVVIGPAADGGYYLIGFNKSAFRPSLFQKIAWSTATVFQDTLKAAKAASLKVHIVPEWMDVDTLEDLKALYERAQNTAFDKSRTMTYLKNNSKLITS